MSGRSQRNKKRFAKTNWEIRQSQILSTLFHVCFFQFSLYLSWEKSNDNTNSNCANKIIALQFMWDFNAWWISRNTTEYLVLDIYYGACELAPLMLQLCHDCDSNFYYFKHMETARMKFRKFVIILTKK